MLLQNQTTKEDISKLSTEELIQKRDALKAIISEAEELLKRVDEQLFVRVDAEEERKLFVGARTVSIVSRANYKNVSLRFAAKYKAVKETVDGSILSAFYKKGVKIPNISFTEYVMVK